MQHSSSLAEAIASLVEDHVKTMREQIEDSVREELIAHLRNGHTSNPLALATDPAVSATPARRSRKKGKRRSASAAKPQPTDPAAEDEAMFAVVQRAHRSGISGPNIRNPLGLTRAEFTRVMNRLRVAGRVVMTGQKRTALYFVK